MGSLKSLCTTSYIWSIETMALKCLVFEKIAFLYFGDKLTNKQTNKKTNRRTDEQMDRPVARSSSRCRERRLNNEMYSFVFRPLLFIAVNSVHTS